MISIMRISFTAGAIYKGKLFFSAYYLNGLFYYDFKTSKTKFVSIFKDEDVGRYLHRKAYLRGSCLWFIPREARNIAIVNLKTLEIKYIKIPGYDPKNGVNFADYAICESRMFLIPESLLYNKLITVDMDSLCIVDTIDIYGNKPDYCLFCYADDSIINVISGDGKVCIKYNMKEGRCIFREYSGNVNVANLSYSSVLKEGDLLYLIPYNCGSLSIVNVCNGEQDSYAIKNGGSFMNACSIEGGIILFPLGYNRSFCKLDIKNKDYQMFALPCDYDRDRWLEIQPIINDYSEDKSLLIAGNDGSLLRLDKKGNIIQSIELKIDEKDFGIIRSQYHDERLLDDRFKGISQEEAYLFSFNEYIRWVETNG